MGDDRVRSDWPAFVNRAQKVIASRSNWTFLKDRQTITIASGATSAALGTRFKQMGEEESPVSFTYGIYELPVKVTTRARMQGAGIWPWQSGPFSLPLIGGYIPIQIVFLEYGAGGWTLNVPPQYNVTQDCEFHVSAFWYPRDLAGGDDRNEMTDDGDLSEAIVNMAKALAYRAEEVDSPKGIAAKAISEEAIQRALYADGAKKFGGVSLRM